MRGLFSVVLLMRSRNLADLVGSDFLYEKSIRLIEANDENDAKNQAKKLGREAEHTYLNESNETIEWKFVKLIEVQELCEENFYSGIEVYSTILPASSCKEA